MLCRKGLILTILSLLLVCTLTATTNSNSATTIQKMNRMPLAFTKNMGQWDDRVLFRASAGGATMWFTKNGVTYQFTRRVANPVGAALAAARDGGPDAAAAGDREGRPYNPGDRFSDNRDSIEQLVLTAKFVGTNPNPEIIAEGQMEYKCNYFIGNEPSKWHTDVPNYETITLKGIYPGIDLKYSGDGSGQAAYEFVVAPGADISQVKVEYEGAEETSIDAEGRMVVRTKWGDMVAAINSPTNGALSGSASFSQLSDKTIGFEASGASRQASGTLSVGLVYSTYLGGGSEDAGWDIAVDGSGNVYITGYTESANFPTQNPYQATDQGSIDAFVTKLDSTGNGLIYSTYLGGSSDDYGFGIAVNGSGNVYVTGRTWSTNFPTQNPYQGTFQGIYDAYLAKLNSAGNGLIYSTYLGGSGGDDGSGVVVDGSGSPYVTGRTYSTDFPTKNPYQATNQGSFDAFVTKLDSTGNSLIYSTYVGGSSFDDVLAGIALDCSGSVYLTGRTYSTDFPTKNPYQATNQGDADIFVTKLNSVGDSLIYSTYLGGSSGDYGWGIAVDDSGNAYVAGQTGSTNYPSQNPYQATYQGGYWDASVTKLNSTGNGLIYSTYLGGSSNDIALGVAVNGSSNASVAGRTKSANFPTKNPYQATNQGDYDAFVTELDSTGNSLIYSTYLGGSSQDQLEGSGIAYDGSGNTYVTGGTGSFNFPTLNPYDASYNGSGDAFVTKLSPPPPYLCGDANGDAAVNISDAVYLIAYIFVGGTEPEPFLSGDANCDSTVNISDAVYLIAYIFASGTEPCATCK